MAKPETEITPAVATSICVAGGLVLAFGLVEFHKFRVAHDVEDVRERPREARAPLVPVAEAAPAPQAQTWFVANDAFTSCHETGGPAPRIEAIQANGQDPRVTETTGPTGGLQVEVEVSLPGGFESTYSTYYRLQSDCEASIAQQTSLADRYR